MRRVAAAILMILVCAGAATADGWPMPRTISLAADWPAARSALPVIPNSDAAGDRLAAVTSLAAERFPAIANSPVPVLLPFAIGDDIFDRAADDVNPVESYLSGFEPTRFFQVGPTGYDATFALRTADVPAFSDIDFRDPVVVQISAFNLLYELPDAKGATRQSPGDIARDFPGITRQILEHTLRYSFERFGIAYVVSVQCFDGPQRRTRLACRNADRIALRFLRALRMVGGNPAMPIATTAPDVARTTERSIRRLSLSPGRQADPRHGDAHAGRQCRWHGLRPDPFSRRRSSRLCQHPSVSTTRRSRDRLGCRPCKRRRRSA